GPSSQLPDSTEAGLSALGSGVATATTAAATRTLRADFRPMGYDCGGTSTWSSSAPSTGRMVETLPAADVVCMLPSGCFGPSVKQFSCCCPSTRKQAWPSFMKIDPPVAVPSAATLEKVMPG